jgi:hypothetical protein
MYIHKTKDIFTLIQMYIIYMSNSINIYWRLTLMDDFLRYDKGQGQDNSFHPEEDDHGGYYE